MPLLYKGYMSPSDRIIAFRPDADVLEKMQELRVRDGIPLSEQIRRALRHWLQEEKKILPPPGSARARVAARKRSGRG